MSDYNASDRISDFELGWIVGILEGEGWFGLSTGRGACQVVTVKMTDEDTVARYASIISKLIDKTLCIREKEDKRPNCMNSFECTVSGESARILMRTVVSHMCYRRRQRIWQSLNGYKFDPRSNLSTTQILQLVRSVS